MKYQYIHFYLLMFQSCLIQLLANQAELPSCIKFYKSLHLNTAWIFSFVIHYLIVKQGRSVATKHVPHRAPVLSFKACEPFCHFSSNDCTALQEPKWVWCVRRGEQWNKRMLCMWNYLWCFCIELWSQVPYFPFMG